MINKYNLVYQITALPSVLYSSITPADEPLTFDKDKLFVPSELNGLPIELRVGLYDPKGELVELTSSMLPSAPATIAASANLVGLKLVNKLVSNLNSK